MESLKELRARALKLGVDKSMVSHRGRKQAWLEAIRSAELSLVREIEVQTESETLIKVGAVSPGYQDELLSLKDAAGKKLDSRPTLLTFFCGGGLFTEGAKLAGFQPVGAIDSDPEVVKIYNSNNVVPAVNAPIRSRYCPEYPDVTLIQASPPCTNFSLADNTKRDKESFADLSLSLSIIEAALASNPKALSRREVGRPSSTVRACKNSRSPYAPNVVIDYGSPNQKVYKLNSRSLARLQGVPDTYKLSGERVDYTVIGNGVSVPIAQTLCEFIKETLELDKALNDAWILCNGDKDLFLDVSSEFLPIGSDLGVNFLEDK